MSLYGALFSGVSGLTAQSSAMGAISDNITNVSTIGYKGTTVNFQTLVTKQASATFYSAGGVQSKPRQQTDVQGLLQASTSQTDVALSGNGFFVVNEANTPGVSDPYLFTRAGSFIQDDEGYLRNSQGYYLQGWPTDASGTVIPANSDLSVTNQNIISTDYLESINLSRVGGTAAATSSVAIGANLPATGTESEAGDTHKTDVQFFDSLGTANNMSVVYTKSSQANNWDIGIAAPPGTSVATIYDDASTPLVYASTGLLEFSAKPDSGTDLIINGITYNFVTTATSGTNIDVSSSQTISDVVADIVAQVKSQDPTFAIPSSSESSRIAVKDGDTSSIVFTESGVGDFIVNPSNCIDSNGDAATAQTSSYTVKKVDNTYSDFSLLRFNAVPANNSTITIASTTYTFTTTELVGDLNDGDTNIYIGGTLAQTMADLETAIENQSPTLAATGNRVRTIDLNGTGVNTLYIESVDGFTNTIKWNATFQGAGSAAPQDGDGNSYAATDTISVSTTHGIVFDSDGVPTDINAVDLEILGYASGAEDMSDATNEGERIALDFGTAGEADGMTQYGEEFSPNFITQNGSKFGTFAGVTIDQDGLVTALFDNGETRKIFQIPVATFTNPNQLESKSGNVWSATQASGDYTLRVADTGPAGQVVQSALEASTVDIGAEFTNMIVVQRAYSASTKIITTADQMLEELMRTK